ncbi:histidine phosphatase family protein [Magnetospirillum aberrantis]|uniref:Histidine phosphatase family protein n=1 Tax=Magnetospirillum aberrantis SpK TaxID=908842 RepID=A0A7C9QV59_9PROT|nr:histidine phosphatase family protein [Magnetospirillum aberrantis]NFV81262.1 histidine phosphatase family protein [Magnetospirillum aberrantis SpK]
MFDIILLRHGETQWNRQKRIQGHGDSPLTLRGIEQAKAYGRTIKAMLGDDLANWRLVSSPLPRCLQTASILSEVAGMDFAALESEGRIKEISTGHWMGRLKSEMPAEDLNGEGTRSWFFRCPGGESYEHFAQRLGSWLSERGNAEKMVVVSHGVAGRVLRGLHMGIDPDQALSAGESPQDAIFRLRPGHIERISCG